MNDIVVFKGSDNVSLLDEIENFRFHVWSCCIDQQVANKRFKLSGEDLNSWHLVLYLNGNIAGTARLTIVNSVKEIPDMQSFGKVAETMKFPLAILGRLTIDPEQQRKGYAKDLITKRIQVAESLGVIELWIEVLDERVSSMGQFGFVEVDKSEDTSIPGNWRLLKKIIC